MSRKKIVLFGAGGHALSVIDAIKKQGSFELVALIDDRRVGESILGIQIWSESQWIASTIRSGLVAIGENSVRLRVAEKTEKLFPQFEWITAIHPSAIVAEGVTLGGGSVLLAGTVINPLSTIGEHCIVNTRASIDHECVLARGASIAPGAILGGNVRIGQGSMVGIGATVIHSMTIGSDTLIGAGSVVTKEIPDQCIACGSPARKLRTREPGEKML